MRVRPPPVARAAMDPAAQPLVRGLAVAALLFLFLLGVNGLGDAFKSLGGGLIESFFAATRNPFMGLMVGILATTLVQSSSVTTSLIVGLVAAPENPLPLANAIPMVMGANIGTTVTNTVVSLAHMGRKQEFYRAFSVATCHDFFNYLAVAAFLPLELATGYLQRTARSLASMLTGVSGVEYDSPIKGALKAALIPIKTVIQHISDSPRLQSLVLVVFSVLLIYFALMLLVRVMRRAMRSRVEVIVARGLHKAPAIGILAGILVTVMVQSSSITTSLLVPLAGAGVITLAQAFPITIGANIGTTVTALLAALAVTGPNARFGITIALVHLLFNMSATLLVFSTDRIRNIPLTAARRLAAVGIRSRTWALLYVFFLFYGLPALFAVLNRFV